MATQKITFSLPKDLVTQLVRRVPARQRSRHVAEALAWKLKERDRLLARACEVASRSRAVRTVEREFDVLTGEFQSRQWSALWIICDRVLSGSFLRRLFCSCLCSQQMPGINELQPLALVIPLGKGMIFRAAAK